MTAASSRVNSSDLERLLLDDVPYGDLTTDALGIADIPGEMTFVVRDPMTIALVEEAVRIIEFAGCRVEVQARTGDILPSGAPVLRARGPAGGLLRSWKVAQTLIETWSGVATAAREMTQAARTVSADAVVACTRKHTPGAKSYAAAAVKAGGAVMHRMGLSETVVVFPQHLSFVTEAAWATLVERLRRATPEKKLVIEVNDVDAGAAAAKAGFDVIQAERFTPRQIADLSLRVGPAKVIAAAGGVNAANAADFVAAGANVLVTSWPYSARPRDIQVRIDRSR
ncbi:MAG TPA: ModD protein [Rhodoblastus sp.]|nr:ModD protein [Rhodoblastus sp.]